MSVLVILLEKINIHLTKSTQRSTKNYVVRLYIKVKFSFMPSSLALPQFIWSPEPRYSSLLLLLLLFLLLLLLL